MTRIATPRTHRPIDAGQRRARAAEAAILAAGIVFAGLMAGPVTAYGAGQQGLQLAAAPTGSTSASASGAPDSLDLDLPQTRTVASDLGDTPTYDQSRGTRVTDLDEQSRLHGVHRLEIDLYPDDMRPRAGGRLR